MLNVVVCGATGFIGRNIAERLAQRTDVCVRGIWHSRPPFNHPRIEWHRADLCKADDVDRVVSGADVVIQAAATTSGAKDIVSRPYIHVADNAVMNSLLLRAAFEHHVGHFVFFSCTVMYPSSNVPLAEEDFDAAAGIHPRYFGVGWTKVYVEKMCEFYAGLGRTRHAVIRHSNIYGPHDKYDPDRSHVFGATVRKVMTAKDKVVVWGSGEEARDLLHVDDLVRFVELAVDRQREPFLLLNCGAGKAVAVKDLVAAMVRISGRSLEVDHDLSQPTIKTSLCLNCDKAGRTLGWAPVVALDDGIRRTLAWYAENVAQGGGA
ncbi:MAG: NAD-dependent epimerase/dehydratase family protein [Pirellulales bacterium]